MKNGLSQPRPVLNLIKGRCVEDGNGIPTLNQAELNFRHLRSPACFGNLSADTPKNTQESSAPGEGRSEARVTIDKVLEALHSRVPDQAELLIKGFGLDGSSPKGHALQDMLRRVAEDPSFAEAYAEILRNLVYLHNGRATRTPRLTAVPSGKVLENN